MSQLTLDGVTKRFGEGEESIVAVDDLSIDVEDGEFLVLVGPSGCGKSTTLRMVAGLESVTSGRIALGGTDITARQPADRGIAMVFQSYALYPHMTVRGNMRFGLEESTDLDDEEITRRVESTAEKLGIAGMLDRKPGELSGGQQQRVALGRAIVREPDAFLMDEPLSNLDAKLRSQMRTELKRLQDDLDTTTVYVTHDQTEAMTMGDRIAILDDGKLQQVATPLSCYHEPANRFVAGFIGEPSMNFFEARLEDGRLVGDGLDYPLTTAQVEAIGDRERITLGVRPEDVVLTDEADDHTVAATVGVVEPMGNEQNVYLSFPDREDSVVATTHTTGVTAGDAVEAALPPDCIHLFDTRTGEAVHNRERPDDESAPGLGAAGE